jgi:flavin-dependent dehydrogenase
VFPGGALVGCDAGYLTPAASRAATPRIKTGMLAAQAATTRSPPAPARRAHAYPKPSRKSWLFEELNKAATSRHGSRRA